MLVGQEPVLAFKDPIFLMKWLLAFTCMHTIFSQAVSSVPTLIMSLDCLLQSVMVKGCLRICEFLSPFMEDKHTDLQADMTEFKDCKFSSLAEIKVMFNYKDFSGSHCLTSKKMLSHWPRTSLQITKCDARILIFVLHLCFLKDSSLSEEQYGEATSIFTTRNDSLQMSYYMFSSEHQQI